MEFSISLGLAGWAVLLIGAVVVGVAAQLFGEVRFGYEWIITAIAAAIGAVILSEFVTGFRTFEPVWDGLALVPAAVGGVVLGLVAATVTRYATEGSFFRPMSGVTR